MRNLCMGVAFAAILLAVGCNQANSPPKELAIEQSVQSTAELPEIHPDLQALKTAAGGIEPGKDLDAYVNAWERVKIKAAELYGEDHVEARYAQSEIDFKYSYTGEFKKAFELQKPYAAYLQGLGPEYEYHRILASEKLTTLYTNLGQGEEAIKLTEQTLNYWRQSNREEKYDRLVNSLNSLATAKLQRGYPVEALEYSQEALDIVKENEGFEKYEPYLLYNLTNYLSAAGRNAEAFEASREGIRRMAELGQTDHIINGFMLTSLASQLHNHGHYEESIETSKASVAVLQELYGPHAPRVYQVQTVLLGLLIKQGHYDDAVRLANNLLPILEESDGAKTRNYLFFLTGKRRAEFLREPTKERLERYSEAIDQYEGILGENNKFTLGARRNEMMLFDQIGEVALALEKAQALEARYADMDARSEDEVRVVRAFSGLLSVKAGTSSGLEKAYAAYGDARDDFQQSLMLADRSVRPSLYQVSVMETALEASLWQGDLEKAFEIGQIYTFGGVRAALAKSKARTGKGPKATQKLIRQRQDDLESKAALIADQDRASRANNKLDVERISRQLDAVNIKLSLSTKKLSKTFPDWMAAESLQVATLKKIQSQLTPDEGVLVPIVTDRGIAVFGITSSGVSAEFVDLNVVKLRQLVKNVRRSIDTSAFSSFSTGVGSNDPEDTGYDIKNAQAIYAAILPKDVRLLFKGTTTLYVSTNNVLSSLPLGALANSKAQGSMPRYLMDEFAIINLPYLGDLKSGSLKSKRIAGRYFGIGAPKSFESTVQKIALRSAADSLTIESLPPLPNAETELRTVAALNSFKSSKLLLGQSATEDAVKNLNVNEGDIVVFATHGLLAGELIGVNEPALILSASGTDDGVLTAREISKLNFPADLVVLSACNTGGHGSGSAEGLSGLASSFFYAGSQNLLVSHWPVRDDAAAFLTINVIKNSEAGMPKAQALQKAMKDLRNNKDIPNSEHPAIWAPFVLVGQ